MTLRSSLLPDLIAAYRATHYRVLQPREFTLNIGQPCPELAALYHERRVTCAAFLTAWNPLSVATDAATNAAFQRELADSIAAQGYPSLAGFGTDPSGQWPGEDSLLVLGIDRRHASDLGNRFRQNAIVWIGADAVPELVLLR